MTSNELLDDLLKLDDQPRFTELRKLSDAQRDEFATHWRLWARRNQLPPEGDWRCWLVMAGRGFGKTRAGAEWVRDVAERDGEARIALVASSLVEARAVMVEGERGILAVSPPGRGPVFEPSLRRLKWPNGAQATLYSAQEPESLRGPQHSHGCWAGSEGDLRQRGPRADRCSCPLRDRRAGQHSPCNPERRDGLADRSITDRRMGWQIGQARFQAGRQLVVRYAM